MTAAWSGFQGVRLSILVPLVGIGLLAASLALYTAHVDRTYEETVAFAERDTRNAAGVLAELTSRAFDAADRALRAAIDVHDGLARGDIGSGREANLQLRRIQEGSPFIISIMLTDAAGNRGPASLPGSLPSFNVAEFPFFSALRDDPKTGIYIAPPFFSRMLKRQVISASRRLEKPGGGFDGIAAVAIDPDYFTQVFRSIDLGPTRAAALILRSGELLAREPPAPNMIGTSLADRLPAGTLDRPDATLRLMSPIDGAQRIVTTHHVPGVPLGIAVSVSRRAVISAWVEDLATEIPIIVLGSIMAGLASLLAGRELRRREEAAAALTTAHAEAQATIEARSAFFAELSHELRTPLNAIIGFSEIIRDGSGQVQRDQRSSEYANDISMTGRQLLGMVNQLLDLAKLEAGKWVLHEDECSLNEIAEVAASLLRPAAEKQKTALHLQLDPSLPLLWADGRLLSQIATNLLSNAVKFTPAGGSVEIATGFTGEGAPCLTVRDTGAGMTPDDMRRALTPYEQGGAARGHVGTGLGLPLAKAFAELHRGRLDLVSQIGKGTTVTLLLPAERMIASGPTIVPLRAAAR